MAYFLSLDVICTLMQHEREAALREFRQGKITVLVATDVASRGLDVTVTTSRISFFCSLFPYDSLRMRLSDQRFS